MAKNPSLEPQSLTKSFHEALILAALLDGPLHGYQLALDIEERSAGAFRFKHGTLYPILHKLEQEGRIRGTWDPGAGGRRRKRYAITKQGRRHVGELRVAWEGFCARFLEFLGRADA